MKKFLNSLESETVPADCSLVAKGRDYTLLEGLTENFGEGTRRYLRKDADYSNWKIRLEKKSRGGCFWLGG